MNKHAASPVSESLCAYNDLHKGFYTIRRAANLVFRMKLLGFLPTLHNEPESSDPFYAVSRSRLLGTLYMERCVRKDGTSTWILSLGLSSRREGLSRRPGTPVQSRGVMSGVFWKIGKDHTRPSPWSLLGLSPREPPKPR